MSGLRITHVGAEGLAPFVDGLRALEAEIRYPMGDADTFSIDHGAAYHLFFSEMGAARFLVACDGGRVVGVAVGVARTVDCAAVPVPGLYVCDLKVARSHRGQGLARRMLVRGLWELARTPALRRSRFLYGAAMVGPRGDVMRSARGWNPLRLGRPLARAAVYFVAPGALAELDPAGAPPPPRAPGLNLSAAAGAGSEWVSTTGRKDLRLTSSGQPWPLAHLTAGPAAWQPTLGHHLQRCGRALVARGAAGPACFAVDRALGAHVDWLAAQGLRADASFTVYGFGTPVLRRRFAWVHIATSDV